jgi:carbamoyltransferase
MAVNTSLNVGTPIVQTPAQAIEALRRAKAMTGVVFISTEQDAFIAWHTVAGAATDGGHELLERYDEWKTGARLAAV